MYNDIYIIIPTHNRANLLDKTISLIYNSAFVKQENIIIIDDGSTDNTKFLLSQKYSNVKVIRGTGNYWWTKSINVGLQYLIGKAEDGDLILLLNDDIEFDTDFIQCITKKVDGKRKEIYGAINAIKNTNGEESVYFCGGQYDWKYSRHKSNKCDLKISNRLSTDIVYGRGLLIPWLAINEVGLFDEKNFPQYIADEDFGCRATKKGYSLYIQTEAKIYVNTETTSSYSLSLYRVGLFGLIKALTSLYSPYNLRQNFIFACRNAKNPLIFTIIRYLIILKSENLNWLKII